MQHSVNAFPLSDMGSAADRSRRSISTVSQFLITRILRTRLTHHHVVAQTSSRYSTLSPADTAKLLETDLTCGLTSTGALSLLRQFGPNEITKKEPDPLWLRFIKQFQETLILLLLGSAVVSFLMGNFDDAISIAVAVTIVVSVGFIQEFRSERSIAALTQLVPNFAHVIRVDRSRQTSRQRSVGPNSSRAGSASRAALASDLSLKDSIASLEGAEANSSSLPATMLVPGDLILFHAGDRIPADVRITHAAELCIDESNFTGEPEPVTKTPDTLDYPDDSLRKLKNIAFMGTLVSSGHGSGIVIATGDATEFGRISSSIESSESPRTPFQLSMDQLGKDLSYMSFGIIGFIVLVGLLRGWSMLDMFTIGVSLAVAAIPEGLPIIITVTLALGVLRLSKRNVIVRHLPRVETLGSVNVLCTDKTGGFLLVFIRSILSSLTLSRYTD